VLASPFPQKGRGISSWLLVRPARSGGNACFRSRSGLWLRGRIVATTVCCPQVNLGHGILLLGRVEPGAFIHAVTPLLGRAACRVPAGGCTGPSRRWLPWEPAAGRRLASYSLPRRQPPRGIAPLTIVLGRPGAGPPPGRHLAVICSAACRFPVDSFCSVQVMTPNVGVAVAAPSLWATSAVHQLIRAGNGGPELKIRGGAIPRDGCRRGKG
jgi:hypothetical protein